MRVIGVDLAWGSRARTGLCVVEGQQVLDSASLCVPVLGHDADGQLLTGTLMDYALPKADCVPTFEIADLETPSPAMPGGLKGMGEGGTIGALAAIANPVADAVRPLGVSVRRLPIIAEYLANRT